MKIVIVNGSPRKNWNTAKILQKVAEGAESLGAETNFINLFDYKFVGCKSCFACKIKNSKTNGICAIKDDLQKKVPIEFVITMGAPPSYYEKMNYDILLGITGHFLKDIFCDNENFFVTHTYKINSCSRKFCRRFFLQKMFLTDSELSSLK